MKSLLLTLLVSGLASRYDPYVFEKVIANRQTYHQLPSIVYDTHYIALADCDRVGERVLVCYEDCWYALVADCAGVEDGGLAWMWRNNIAGEVDYNTAMTTGCVGKVISVYTIGPAQYRYE